MIASEKEQNLKSVLFHFQTGFGGYGSEFTLDMCLQYVEDCGGYKEFDYYC